MPECPGAKKDRTHTHIHPSCGSGTLCLPKKLFCKGSFSCVQKLEMKTLLKSCHSKLINFEGLGVKRGPFLNRKLLTNIYTIPTLLFLRLL